MYSLGRLLQLIGLLILPIAIAGEASDSMTLGRMLMWAIVGIIVFGAGWMLQNAAGKK